MFAEIIEVGVAWKEICVKVKLYKLLEFYRTFVKCLYLIMKMNRKVNLKVLSERFSISWILVILFR
jgi:hypothetical protein